MEPIALRNVTKFVLYKHHLTQNSKIDDIIQITNDLCGLHSTELSTSYLSLFERTKNFKKEDLEKELYVKKTIGRIRGMRKTLFLQTREMIPIVHVATFKLSEKNFEKYMEFHKVSLSEYKKVSKEILNILEGNELSASEIRKELDSNLNIPAVIQIMCNYGLLIRGRPIKNWKDRRNKYVRFKDYFPNIDLSIKNAMNAIQILVEKYLRTYGPVTMNDLSWWSGLTKTEIKKALNPLESYLSEIQISTIQGKFIIFKSDIERLQDSPYSDTRSLSFLPKLDPYPMGYKEREKYINSKNYNMIFDRSGNVTSTIFLDGIAIGVWDVEEKPKCMIKYHLFHSIEKDIMDELHYEAKKIGEFYFEEDVDIVECESMTPLTERTAGGFMTPLKNC
jgi:hypothetical protein